MGKKYIIEIGRLERLYKAFVGAHGKPEITWLSPEVDLTPYTEPDLKKVRKEGYQQGLSDAKEGKATCQYCEYEYLDETEEPCKKCCKAYMNKYKPKAKEEQIQVGDEVNWMGDKYVVTYVRCEAKKADLISCKFGSACENVAFSALVKTGRHFPEIAEVLAKMREESNG